MFQVLGGCAPTVKPDPVFMPRDEDCKPVAEMQPAPKVISDDGRHNAANIALMLANPQALGEGRLVLLDYKVGLKDLLKDGETVPEAEDARSELASERIGELGDAACSLLPKSFSQSCINSFTGLDLNAAWADQPILVSQRLIYAPTAPIGDLPEDNGALRLFVEEVSLSASTAAERAAIVADATAAAEGKCAEKRTQFGNCMVSFLTIREVELPTASLAWIAP
jgi:hypothetical protein